MRTLSQNEMQQVAGGTLCLLPKLILSLPKLLCLPKITLPKCDPKPPKCEPTPPPKCEPTPPKC